jgi:DNA-directed RNA polymerase specialized sigma24 family protein
MWIVTLAESAVIEEQNIPWNDLIERAKAGQSQARDRLCRELSVRLRQLTKYRLWGWSQQDQEDIVQDCLCTFLQKLDLIESNPQGYACEILRNKIGNALQRRKILKVPLQSDTQDGSGLDHQAHEPAFHANRSGDFAAMLETRERLEMVAGGITRLPDFCRNFFLGLLEGRPIRELWILFNEREPGLQRGAFDKRVFDCRKRLRQLVGDDA